MVYVLLNYLAILLVQDSITSQTGNSGTVQFSASGSGSTSATPTGNTTVSTAGPPTQIAAASRSSEKPSELTQKESPYLFVRAAI